MVFQIIFSILIFIFVVPIKISGEFYLNLLENRGAFAFEFWNKVVISQGKFFIANGVLTSRNRWNKQHKMELTQDDKDVIFIQLFVNTYFRKIILELIEIYFDMGIKDDAYVSTMANSSFVIASEIALNILKTKKSGFKSCVYPNALFSTDKLSVLLKIDCWSNAFDLIFALTKSKLKAIFRKSKKQNYHN